MLRPLDGPSKQGKLSVTTSVAVEIKIEAGAYSERKVITLQPLDGKILVYFADEGVVPSAATVSSDGFEHPKKAVRSYEATDKQALYMVSSSGTVNVITAERA